VLDVLLPEIVLQRPRVVAIVGELKPTGVAKHVGVDRAMQDGGARAGARHEAIFVLPPNVYVAPR